jgi:hypothetical protein
MMRPAQTRPRDFGGLARQISAWTTNLLASAIVLAGGLAIGWQVISWWHDDSANAAANDEAALDQLKLPLADQGHEFWTSSGLLKVERVRGNRTDALDGMRAFCRATPPVVQRAEARPGEMAFVAQVAEEAPLEEAGGIALYQPKGQDAMVVAVDRRAGRIVGWSFALPAGQQSWSLYHFRPAGNGLAASTASIAKQAP